MYELAVDNLATRLRVPRSWVYSHADDLGAYKFGKYLRFSWPRVIERLERVTGDSIVGARLLQVSDQKSSWQNGVDLLYWLCGVEQSGSSLGS